MKVLALNPPFKTNYGRFSRTSRSPAITKSGTLYYPIWLAYAAGRVEQAGFETALIDSCAYEFDREKTLEKIKEFSPDFCILDTSTPSIYNDAEVGALIKKNLPTTFVVLMGTHPTALTKETLKLNKSIDGVIVGEADDTARELARVLGKADKTRLGQDLAYRKQMLSPVKGFAFNCGEETVVNPLRPLIENLDELPFVSQTYHKFLDEKKYFFAASHWPEVQIMTSRGCIANCTFCLYPQVIHRHGYRVRSAKNVVDELGWIAANMPQIKEIGLEDATFNGSEQRVVEICQEIIKRGIKIKWYTNVRANLKNETMKWMKRAGCILVTVGYESADAQILRNIRKGITPSMIREFSQNCRKNGLLVHGCFMAGNRGETKQTLKKTLDLALELFDDTMQFFPLIAYPGTLDFAWAKENGLLTISDWRDYLTEDGNHNSVVRMPEMTSEEIREWCNYARKKYYLRPSYLFYKIKQQIFHPSEFIRNWKAFKRFVPFILKP